MPASGLRVGIITDGLLLEAWQLISLERLVANGNTDISLVVAMSGPARRKRGDAGLGGLFVSCISDFVPKFRQRRKKISGALIEHATVIEVTAQENSNGSFGLSGGDLDAIRHCDLDFIVTFSSHLLCGDVLKAARHGVWAFSHQDPSAISSGPPGFWEIYRGADTITTALEVLGDEPEFKIHIREAITRTCRFSRARTMERAHRNSERWLQKCAEEIRLFGQIRNQKVVRLSGVTDEFPNRSQFLVYLLLLCRNLAVLLWSKTFYVDQWMIGYAKASISKFIKNPATVEFAWITPENGLNFVADPFLVEGNRLRIYCEYFDYHIGVGEIVELREENDFSIEDRTQLLADGTHFSYPFVWADEKGLVVIPENLVSDKITAYEVLVPGKTTISAQHEIIVGGQFVDPTLLLHDELYWCFAIKEDEGASQNLHLFFSESLYGPYQSHPMNPVKSDIGSARPAGRPIKIADRILRPSQDCSRTYGGSIKINEITELSKEAYSEVTILDIRPEMLGGFEDGCHHLDHTDNFIVIDTKRSVFHPLAWWFTIKERLSRRP